MSDLLLYVDSSLQPQVEWQWKGQWKIISGNQSWFCSSWAIILLKSISNIINIIQIFTFARKELIHIADEKMTRRRLLSNCLSLFSTSPSASIVSNTIGFHCPSLLLSQGQAMRLTVLWESGSLRQLHTHSLFSLASTLRNLLLTPSHFHKLTIFLLCFHRLQQRATIGKSASSSRLQLLSHAENSNSDMHTCWGSLGEKVSMCVCVCVCTGLTHCVGVCLQVGLFAYEHKLTLLMRRMCPSYFLVWCSLPQGSPRTP